LETNVFTKIDNETSFYRLNGELRDSNGDVRVEFKNYPIDYHPEPLSTGQFPTDWLNPDLIAIAHHIAGRTNPSKPEWSVPQAVGELFDLVETGLSLAEIYATIVGRIHLRGKRKIRWLRELHISWKAAERYRKKAQAAQNAGTSGAVLDTAKTLAEGNILWRFGISPMINDLRKLVQLHDLARRRLRKLEKLATGKPLRYKVKMGHDVLPEQRTSVHLHSLGVDVYATKVVTVERTHWGTVKWAPLLSDALAPGCPLGFTPQVTNLSVGNYAGTLGLNEFGVLEAAWELFPWSWLGSWFANYGAWLDANNYSIPVNPYHMCYMMTLKVTTTYEDIVKPPWLSLAGIHKQTHTRKYRIPIDNSALWIPPLTSLSCISGGQSSVLASLFLMQGYLPSERRFGGQEWSPT
jgi:hypothetical protein